MYHQADNRRHRFFTALAACLYLISSPAPPAGAGASGTAKPQEALPAVAESDAGLGFPVLPAGQRLRDKPGRAIVYQLDLQPIGDRRPLLLVHGLRGEYRTLFRWDRVIKKLEASSEFRDRYKIYLLRYDSTRTLKTVIPQFQRAVLEMHRRLAARPISLLALSLGGNLVEQAMLDPQTNSAIELVFTLATPFHGSPLFSADWFQYSLYKNLAFPWTRVDHSLDYRVYFAHNPNLLSDLAWDNADGYMPEPGHFRSLLPLGPSGNLDLSRDANDALLCLHRDATPDKSKFICYAGYLLNPYLLPSPRRQFESTVLAPYTFFTIKFPAHLLREHPVLGMLNREISRIVPRDDVKPRPENWPHVYGLNDGITPVGSAVFLPSAALRANTLSREDDLQHLRGATDVMLARVFRNVDHLTFIDGYRPGHGSSLVRDELNPLDGYRQIFDWILSDLLHAEPISGQIARENREPGQAVTKSPLD